MTATEDAEFDRVDAKLGRWEMFCAGAAAGALLTGLLVWIAG